jgi:hypothetical protein
VDAELLAEQLERAQQAARDLQTDRQQLVAQLEALTREEGEEGEGGAGEGGRGGWRRLGGAGAELVYEQQLAVKEQEATALRRQLDQLRNRLQVGGRVGGGGRRHGRVCTVTGHCSCSTELLKEHVARCSLSVLHAVAG